MWRCSDVFGVVANFRPLKAPRQKMLPRSVVAMLTKLGQRGYSVGDEPAELIPPRVSKIGVGVRRRNRVEKKQFDPDTDPDSDPEGGKIANPLILDFAEFKKMGRFLVAERGDSNPHEFPHHPLKMAWFCQFHHFGHFYRSLFFKTAE